MELTYEYTNNQLKVNGRYIYFPYSIRDVQKRKDQLIVLLEVPPNDPTVDNLYAVTDQGEMAWQAQHLSEVYPLEKILPYEQMVVKEEEIRAMDFYGRCYFLDPRNGKILKRSIYR